MKQSKSHARWFLCTTQPRREKWAGENVKRLGHEFYLPMCRETLVDKGQKKERDVPLFPRYMFVWSRTGQWRFLTGTFGVTGVVMDATDKPAPVPQDLIDGLKADEKDGVFILPVPEPEKFKKGERVRMPGTAFTEELGIYDGMTGEDRARVLLSILGVEIPVEVSLRALRRA